MKFYYLAIALIVLAARPLRASGKSSEQYLYIIKSANIVHEDNFGKNYLIGCAKFGKNFLAFVISKPPEGSVEKDLTGTMQIVAKYALDKEWHKTNSKKYTELMILKYGVSKIAEILPPGSELVTLNNHTVYLVLSNSALPRNLRFSQEQYYKLIN